MLVRPAFVIAVCISGCLAHPMALHFRTHDLCYCLANRPHRAIPMWASVLAPVFFEEPWLASNGPRLVSRKALAADG